MRTAQYAEQHSKRYEPSALKLAGPQAAHGCRPPMATADLRVASYNIRVDHTADRDSVHEWSKRRNLAATVRRLGTRHSSSVRHLPSVSP